MNELVKQIIVGTLVTSLITSQSFAASHGNGARPLVVVGQAFVRADATVPLMDLLKSTDANLFLNEVSHGQIQEAHLVEAQKIIAHFKSQGRELNTVTKQDLLNLYPNLQEQNVGMYLLCLLPLAIVYISLGMMEGSDRYEQHKQNYNYQAQQEARVQRAQAQIAEAQARAAKAEAEAAEARAAQAKADAQKVKP